MSSVLKCVSRVTCVLLNLIRAACCFLHAHHRPTTLCSLTFLGSCEDNRRETSPKANRSSGLEREIIKGLFVGNHILKNNPVQVDLASNTIALVNINYPIKGIKGRNSN